MRIAEIPPELQAVHAKMLAFQPDPGGHYFALRDALIIRGQERQIVVQVRDAGGQPAVGTYVTQEWPDGHETFQSDGDGRVTFHLGPGSRFTPPRGGPHRVYVGRPESLQSDLVYSLGSPNGQALIYQLTFRETVE